MDTIFTWSAAVTGSIEDAKLMFLLPNRWPCHNGLFSLPAAGFTTGNFEDFYRVGFSYNFNYAGGMENIEVLQSDTSGLSSEEKQFIESNCRRTTLLNLSDAEENASLTVSHTGGPALVTVKHPWPTDSQGKRMIHLATLNLAELPNAADLPDSGLLQFFFIDDEYEVRLIPAADIETGTRDFEPIKVSDYEDYFLIGHSIMTGQLWDQPPSPTDGEYEAMNWSGNEEILWNLSGGWTNLFCGGWASFPQYDPRPEGEKWELLLQLEFPEQEVILQYFIRPQDLKDRNFNNIMFYYSGC